MNSHLQASRGAVLAFGALALWLAAMPASTLAQATLFAEGLVNPSGIYVDDNGYLWVASLGTGLDDAGVYVVTPAGEVHPFMAGLPSTLVMGEPSGASHVYFNNDIELIVVQGDGARPESGSVFTVDTTGFTPGDDPLTTNDIDEIFAISQFVKSELAGGQSNPFAMTFVPNSPTAYVTDAAANAIVQSDDNGLSILAQFPNIPNTGSVGPPSVNAVPTGLDYHDGTIYVGMLTGFPFNEGAASIRAVDTEGNVSIYVDDLTTVVDLQVIPGGGGIVFVEHRFSPNAGILYKYENEELTELATGLDRPVGLRIGHSGEVYVSLLEKGEIVVVEGVVTDTERELPERSRPIRVEAYPNPFFDGVNLAVDVAEAGPASLTIVDVLGRTVYRKEYSRLEAGTHRLRWEGGVVGPISPGSYLYRVEVAGSVEDGIAVKQ
ncbi:MAG TPA: ScyD/ScyE family protein [Rhodothermia bacterium]|nr:ScyD/ScyE family protein [Rhodothermia bacterium]